MEVAPPCPRLPKMETRYIQVSTPSGPADSLRIWSTYWEDPGFLANLAPSCKV